MNRNHNKSSVVTTLVVLLVCLVLVTGSTFSLFTSDSKVNIAVTAGDVELTATIDAGSLALYSKGEAQTGKFANGGTAAFNDTNTELTLTNITPGDSVEFNIVLENESTVDLQYRVNWIVSGSLAEALEATVNDADITSGTSEWTLWKADDTTKSKTLELAIELPLEEDDNWEELAANIAFNVEAVQANATGEYSPKAFVNTAAGLQTAIDSGATEITLNEDIELDGTIIIPAAPTTFSTVATGVSFDLNGKTISANHNKSEGAVIENNGVLTLKNGTVSSLGNNGGSALVNKGIATLENVTLNGAPNEGDGWPSYTVNNNGGNLTITNSKITSYHGAVASYNEGAVITLNNTDIDMAGIDNFTSHGIYTYNSGVVYVNGGDIANHNTTQNASGASVINGNVIISAGNFTGRIENYYGTPVISGGTFTDANAKKYAADGCHALSYNGGYIVLSENVDAAETATLIDLIKNAPVGETTEIVLAGGIYEGDINITLAAFGKQGGDVVIKAADGAKVIFTGTTTLGLYQKQTTNVAMYKAHVTFEGITFDHAESAKHSIDVQSVNSLNLINCTIIGDGEYGIGSAAGGNVGPSKVVGCTFTNAGLQIAGNFGTGLVIDDCDFIESVVNVQGGKDVTIKNSNFQLTVTDAHNNESFYAIRTQAIPMTVTNCTFAIDSTVTGIGVAGSKGWGVFVNRNSANWTVSDVEIIMSEAAMAQDALDVAKCLSTGKINMTNVTVNGALYVVDTAALNTAISNGVSAVWIAEGATLTGFERIVLTNDLTIYGNGASLTAAEDFAIEFHNGQNYAFTNNVTLTIYDLNDVTVWGNRCSGYDFNLTLYNCDDCRIFIMGTTGNNNIYMNNCTVTRDGIGQDTAIYSNANGSIIVENCEFIGIECPFNLNHKVAGEMSVQVTNCTFADCGSTGTQDYYAPIRLCNNTEGAAQTLIVSGCTFTYSEGKAPVNSADVLLNADGVGKNDKGTISASIQDDAIVKAGVNVTFE